MGKREELIALYEASTKAITQQLDEIDKNRKIYPLWTIREIVAHLSGWDDAAIGYLSAVIKGEKTPTPAMRGAVVYNEETVSTREGLSYDHIVREYYSTRERLLSLIRTSNEELLTTQATLPWGGEDTFVELATGLCDHESTHANDIKNFIQEHNR